MNRKLIVVGNLSVVVLVLFMMFSSVVDARATKAALQDFISDMPPNNDKYPIPKWIEQLYEILFIISMYIMLGFVVPILAYIAYILLENFS